MDRRKEVRSFKVGKVQTADRTGGSMWGMPSKCREVRAPTKGAFTILIPMQDMWESYFQRTSCHKARTKCCCACCGGPSECETSTCKVTMQFAEEEVRAWSLRLNKAHHRATVGR